MIREKSAGAVVYYLENGKTYILIEKMRQGHCSFPKGHMEGQETEIETALREIKEETNLDVNLDSGFRRTVEYSPYPGCMKEVVFFVAEAQHKNIKRQEEEIADLYFLEAEKALAALTFESDKEILRSALEYLKKPHLK